MEGKRFGKKEVGCKCQELSRKMKREQQNSFVCAQETSGMEDAPDLDLKKLRSHLG